MGIGFTGGLDKSDILSDGTPFDGANIDSPISSAGSLDASRAANVPDGATVNLSSGQWLLVPNNSSTLLDGTNFYFEGRAFGGGSVTKYRHIDSSGTEHYGPAALTGDIRRLKNDSGSRVDIGVVSV